MKRIRDGVDEEMARGCRCRWGSSCFQSIQSLHPRLFRSRGGGERTPWESDGGGGRRRAELVGSGDDDDGDEEDAREGDGVARVHPSRPEPWNACNRGALVVLCRSATHKIVIDTDEKELP
jgi:hypothetical protein